MRGQIQRIALALLLASCAHGVEELAEHAALVESTWYFRGTPNGWATTAMTPIAGTSQYETCQTFGGVASPRFKIDRYGDWAESYRGAPLVVYGHTPTQAPVLRHNTINIDQGCAFGGRLTALRYPELETVGVPARAVYARPSMAEQAALLVDAPLAADD